MISTPLLEIIFALFLMVMPEGTKTFTITAPQITPTPIVWTLQEDGTWNGLSKDGQTAFGNWKMDGMKVIRLNKHRTPENIVDLSEWVKKDEGGFLIQGNCLKIGKTEEGAFLFLTEGEPFSEVVRIEPKKK